MNDDQIAFAGGTLLSSIPAFQWLWPLQADTIAAPDLAMVWLFKIFGTVILGFLGGITGMLGKDFYRYIKTKLHEDKTMGGDSSRSGDPGDRLDR